MSEINDELSRLLRASAERAVADELSRALGARAAERTVVREVPSAARSDGAGRTVVSAVLDGMGLSPILRGLLSLFGGGSDNGAPAPLPRYAAPPAVRFNAGLRRDSTAPVAVDYGQGGEAREIAPSAPSVVVNVSAMDSQSFLDRSGDIAEAVKRALLESHSLNDVITEL